MRMKSSHFRNHAVVVFVPLKAQFFSFNMDWMSGPNLHGLHVFPIADESPAAIVLHTFITQVARHCFYEVER